MSLLCSHTAWSWQIHGNLYLPGKTTKIIDINCESSSQKLSFILNYTHIWPKKGKVIEVIKVLIFCDNLSSLILCTVIPYWGIYCLFSVTPCKYEITFLQMTVWFIPFRFFVYPPFTIWSHLMLYKFAVETLCSVDCGHMQ